MDKPQMDKSQYDLATESIASFEPKNNNEIIVFNKLKEMFHTLKELYHKHDGFVKYFEGKQQLQRLGPEIVIELGRLNGIKQELYPLVLDLSKQINLYTMTTGGRTESRLKDIWNVLYSDTQPPSPPFLLPHVGPPAINVCLQKYINLYESLNIVVKTTNPKGGRRLRKRSKTPRRRHRSTRRSTRRRRS